MLQCVTKAVGHFGNCKDRSIDDTDFGMIVAVLLHMNIAKDSRWDGVPRMTYKQLQLPLRRHMWHNVVLNLLHAFHRQQPKHAPLCGATSLCFQVCTTLWTWKQLAKLAQWGPSHLTDTTTVNVPSVVAASLRSTASVKQTWNVHHLHGTSSHYIDLTRCWSDQ